MRECSPPQTCHVSHVTCHVSRVKCHMSHVTCHVSHVTFFFIFFLYLFIFFFFLFYFFIFYFYFFSDKVVELISGGSVINGATPSSLFEMRLGTNSFNITLKKLVLSLILKLISLRLKLNC